MRNNKISVMQLRAIMLLEMLGMESILLPKIAENIYTSILAAAFSVVLAAIVFMLTKNVYYSRLSGFIGKAIQLLFSIKIAVTLALIIYIFSDVVKYTVLENSYIWSIKLILILLCLYCGYKGIECIGRASEILIIFVFLPIIIAYLLSIKNIDYSNYSVAFQNTYLWRGVLLAFCTNAIETGILSREYLNVKNQNKELLKNIALGTFYVLFVALISFGIYGLVDFNLQKYPTMEVIYTSNFFTFFKRQEGIFTAIWLFGAFVYLAIHFYFCQKLFSSSMNIRKNCSLILAGIFIFALSFLPQNISQTIAIFCNVNIYGGLLFMIVVPLLFRGNGK